MSVKKEDNAPKRGRKKAEGEKINFNSKSKPIPVRFSHQEREMVIKSANELGIDVSKYVRTKLKNGSIKVKKIDVSFEKVHYELNKIGVNLNQIAKQMNEKKSDEMKHLAPEIDTIIRQIVLLMESLEAKISTDIE